MSDSLDRYQKLKKELQSQQREADRLAGAIDQTMARLQEEFACQTEEQAQQKLTKMKKQLEQREAAFQEELERFESQWQEKLEQS